MKERFALAPFAAKAQGTDLRPWRRKVPRRGERVRETEKGERGCKTDAEAECGQRQWHH